MQVKVEALRQGYVGHVRIKEGKKFLINVKHFVAKDEIKDKEKLKSLEKKKAFVSVGGKEYLPPTWLKVLDISKVQEEDVSLEPVKETLNVGSDEVI